MFKNLTIAVLALMQMSFYANRAYSQHIKGIVTDSLTHRPIGSATLMLSAEGKGIVKTATTVDDGKFAFSVAGKGTYRLDISMVGYRKYISPLMQLTGDTTVDLGTIALKQETGMLNEVIVQGRKALIQSKGDKLVYNASADIGNKAGSAADVLRKAPMLTVGADGEVKMRGSSNIKVLLNGLPSGVLAKNLKEALKMIPASSIASIEVITTPSAKYEAEGAAGVINIVTKKKLKGTSGSVDLSAGNLERSANGGLNIASGKFNFNLLINANMEKERTASELQRTSLANGKQTGDLLQRMDATQRDKGAYGDFTTEYRPDTSQKLGATVSFWKGRWPVKSTLYNLYRSEKDTMEYNQVSEQDGSFTFWDFSLNYQKKFKRTGQELQLVSQYSRSGDKSDYLTDQYYLSGKHYFRERSPNTGQSKDLSFQADYSHPFNKSGTHTLETGVRYSKSNSKSRYSVFNNRDNPGSHELVEDPSRSDVMDYFQNILAAYLSLRLETRDRWSFRPGLRYERTRLGAGFTGSAPPFRATFSNFVPSMLITKKLDEQHEVKLNYSERIRRPWIWDLNPYVNASDPRNLTFGNPQLLPEITRMFETGHTYSAPSGFTLSSSIYFHSNTNAIESLTTVDSLGISRTTSQNIAANRRLGGNINAYTQIGSNWTINGSAEFFHVWFKSRALGVANDANFYSFSINSSYTLPADYTIQVSGDYSNGYVTLQGRNSANYNYRFSASKELFNKKASITIGINNPFQQTFLQRSYTTASTFHSTSINRHYNRSFTVSFSWQFGSLRSAGESGSRFRQEKEVPMPREKKR
jgi:outer membrane receptor protein involved in Fe transport